MMLTPLGTEFLLYTLICFAWSGAAGIWRMSGGGSICFRVMLAVFAVLMVTPFIIAAIILGSIDMLLSNIVLFTAKGA